MLRLEDFVSMGLVSLAARNSAIALTRRNGES
jgi:hypothetical protein